VKNVDEADVLLRVLIPTLRSYDLVLNEAKSVNMPKSALVTEEPDLEALFTNAVEERRCPSPLLGGQLSPS
jgi:hypothetical protein